MLVKYNELYDLLKNKLLKYNFADDDADLCAKIFSDNSLYGVLSHGVNRFPAFIELVKKGYIKANAKPSLVRSNNAFQQWDGNYGPGPLNAWSITDKVIELADEYGIGCIALRNTNHWMRAGTYGWKAAEKGYILICWTNTIPNLPAHGAKESTTGNNPVVFAVPRKDKPVVLDMALSQFSYGKLASYRREGKKLPLPGGYDKNGNLTDDPAEIYDSYRPIPIGYWKGAGLSLLLDLISTILSGGRSTLELSKLEHDYGMSQIFIAIDPSKSYSAEQINRIVDDIVNYYKSAETDEEEILYPGERALKTKARYSDEGIPINNEILNKIRNL